MTDERGKLPSPSGDSNGGRKATVQPRHDLGDDLGSLEKTTAVGYPDDHMTVSDVSWPSWNSVQPSPVSFNRLPSFIPEPF